MIIVDRALNGGNQKIYRFENDYGASVITGGEYTYGMDGQSELAVIKFTGEDWSICYNTEITDDVIGYLSDSDLSRLLERIQNLQKGEVMNDFKKSDLV